MVSGRLLNGRYRLHSLIGRGGMAEVWRGEDLRLERRVAVKLLGESTDPDRLARFRREARTVARLSHPNIVTGHDLGVDGGVTYLVMELIEGTSLATRLAKGPLTVGDAVAIAGQVCDALAAAHAAGIVHRDIKPGNILLTPAGTVKVCDFGIARLLHASPTQLTTTGTVIGTSEYMAPEQASGAPVDGRTDLYALGCVLYAMLTGSPPFTADTLLAVLSQHLHRSPAPVASHRPGVPAPLAELVDQLLAKNPDDRPPTAVEVRHRLAMVTGAAPTMEAAAAAPTVAVTADSPTDATRVPLGPPMTVPLPTERVEARPAVPRWRRVAVVTAAVLVTAAAAVAVVSLLRSPDGDGPPAITAPTIIAPSATSTAPFTAAVDTHAEMVLATVDEYEDLGQIDPDAADDLREAVDDVVAELLEDGPRAAAREAEELYDLLAELLADGEIGQAAYDALTEAVHTLIGNLPPEPVVD